MDYIKGMSQKLDALALARDAKIAASERDAKIVPVDCDVKIAHQSSRGEAPCHRVVSAAVRVPVRAELLYVIRPLAESRRQSLKCYTFRQAPLTAVIEAISQKIGDRRFQSRIPSRSGLMRSATPSTSTPTRA